MKKLLELNSTGIPKELAIQRNVFCNKPRV